MYISTDREAELLLLVQLYGLLFMMHYLEVRGYKSNIAAVCRKYQR